MTQPISIDTASLRTIFAECRQCGTCCLSYRKITLEANEVEFIRKMGGHVGVDLTLAQLRDRPIDELMAEAAARGKVFMIHPDDKGCLFLQKKNDKYVCRIYHHRPRACRGFRCKFADSSFLELFGGVDSMHLLGKNRFGLPL